MIDNSLKTAFKNPFLDKREMRKKEASIKVDVEILRDGKKVIESVTHKTPDKQVFRKYKPLSEISGSIAKELIGEYAYNKGYKDGDLSKLSYKEIMDQGLTFFMSTDTGFMRTGLLSLLPALSTGIKLYSEMPESKYKTELFSKIKTGIDIVFKFIYRDADWRKDSNLKPVFDASPYESDAFYAGSDDKGLDGRSYIDSISWAVPLFLKIMNLVDEDKKPVFDDEYRNIAKKLTQWCLSYVNNAVLTIDAKDDSTEDENKDYKRPVGWSFSKIVSSVQNAKVRSSLYFTYAAASMYLSIYEEYKDIIDNLQTLNRANDKEIIKLEKEENGEETYHKNNFKKAADEIAKYADLVNSLKDEEKEDAKGKLDELEDALAELKKCDKHKLKDYYSFNDGKSAEYNGKIYTVNKIRNKWLGPVSQLKWNLEKISTDIWEKAKVDDRLENNFVYDDFSFNIATNEAIQSGGQTNALFAGLLHISICLYSKYDFVVSYTEDDGSGKFGKKAYDDMQNTMLLYVQRAQRFFDKLSEKDKAFGVDSLILRFSEDFSNEVNDKGNLTDREVAEKLRKQLIRITSLTPMLLKTNNLISQYVVQYPQKQMGEAIGRIGQKRFYDRNIESKSEKYRWFWESDGYHAMSNYYYVEAIFNFYSYYKQYEEEYTSYYKDLKSTLIKDLEYMDSVREYYQKISDEKVQEEEQIKKEHEEELKAKNDELEREKQKVLTNEIGNKLVSSISEVLENVIDKPEFLRKIINGIRKQLAEDAFERYSKNPEEDKDILEKLKNPVNPKDDSIFSLLRALGADIILQSTIEAKKNSTGRVDELGDGFGDGFKPAEVALNGGEQLIKDGLINNLFAKTCVPVKWKKAQKNKQEK